MPIDSSKAVTGSAEIRRYREVIASGFNVSEARLNSLTLRDPPYLLSRQSVAVRPNILTLRGPSRVS